MRKTISIKFVWIPEKLGGHSSHPWVGMRATLRWQRHIEESLVRAWDIECCELSFDEQSHQGTGIFVFASDDPLSQERTSAGELVEILNGHRVLAVGCIESD